MGKGASVPVEKSTDIEYNHLETVSQAMWGQTVHCTMYSEQLYNYLQRIRTSQNENLITALVGLGKNCICLVFRDADHPG